MRKNMAIILNLTNPIYSSPDGSTIDCMLELDSFPEPIPFTANPNDIEEHGRLIYADIISGKYGPISAYIPPPPPPMPVTETPTVI
jgi:hypothetical protein